MPRAMLVPAILMLAACAAEPPVPAGPLPVPPEEIIPAPATGALIEGAAYDVVSIDGQLVPVGFGAGFTIRDGRLEGNDGCNALSGPVVQTEQTLRIGPLVGTLMACPAPVMDRAARLARALAEVDGARHGPGGTVALTRAGRDRVVVQQQRP